MTLHAKTTKPGDNQLVNTVLVGANPAALKLIPLLARNPQLNLVGILPTHPDDLIHHLDGYGYQLANPCSIKIHENAAELVQVKNLSLIIDAGFNPGTVRALTDAGLDHIPRINPAALDTVMQRSVPSQTPSLFAERLAKEVGRAYRHGRSIALMLFSVTDTNPDDPGQAHLIRVLEQSLRLEDVVATLPNGQVAVVLPETGENTAQVASRLTSNLTNHRIRQGAFGAPPRRYSIGWAWFPQDAKTAPALMEQAKARITPV